MLAQCGAASVPLPPQRRTYTGPEPRPFGAFVRITDPHSAAYLVSGLRPSGRWAWTARRAELRYWVPAGPAYRFTADLYIAVQTLKFTGPVTISVSVNGRRLGAVRCDAAREFFFDQPVPEGWLDAAKPVQVAMEADRYWVSGDGAEFGFLLVSAGFVPQ